MHEFSIAEALMTQVRRYAPPEARVREVEIRAGVLRGLEPDALRMCWEAVTADTPLAGSILRMDLGEWSLSCDACGRSWQSPRPFVTCECGNPDPVPKGGDELNLMAITVDEEPA